MWNGGEKEEMAAAKFNCCIRPNFCTLLALLWGLFSEFNVLRGNN